MGWRWHQILRTLNYGCLCPKGLCINQVFWTLPTAWSQNKQNYCGYLIPATSFLLSWQISFLRTQLTSHRPQTYQQTSFSLSLSHTHTGYAGRNWTEAEIFCKSSFSTHLGFSKANSTLTLAVNTSTKLFPKSKIVCSGPLEDTEEQTFLLVSFLHLLTPRSVHPSRDL